MKYPIVEKRDCDLQSAIDVCDIGVEWLYIQSIGQIMMVSVYVDVVFCGSLVQQVTRI